jgi:hypothetical protein
MAVQQPNVQLNHGLSQQAPNHQAPDHPAPSLQAHGVAQALGDIAFDPVEAYFECITTCSLDDGECITVCTDMLRDQV